MKKRRLNYRVIIPLGILALAGLRLLLLERLPAYLRPGLHLDAYVANTADGTVTAIDLVKLVPVATIAVGADPSGVRAHPTRNEIWGVSSDAGVVWVIDVRSNAVIARIPVGGAPFALDFSRDGRRAYVAASASNSIAAIDCASRRIVARGRAGRTPW
ncbi:MAG: hypothetical protein WAN13_20010, partial [Candidatus Acidiferrales bacterium]